MNKASDQPKLQIVKNIPQIAGIATKIAWITLFLFHFSSNASRLLHRRLYTENFYKLNLP